MRLAGENRPDPASLVPATSEIPVRAIEETPLVTQDTTPGTNNAGKGPSAVITCKVHDGDMRELLERSNQLAERFSVLLQCSNEQAERFTRATDQANQLAEHLNRSGDHSNNLADHLNRSSDHSNRLTEQAYKSVERFGDVLRNINSVLVGIQHAIVRGHAGNTINALDCLINEKGETPCASETTGHMTFMQISESHSKYPSDRIRFLISGASRGFYSPDWWLGRLLRFYGIGEGLYENEPNAGVTREKEKEARLLLNRYLSSCLG